MKKLYLAILPLALGVSEAFGQGFRADNGVHVVMSGAVNIHVSGAQGNISLNSGATLDARNNVLLTGNWTNNAVFNSNDGTVLFIGTSPQSAGGTSLSVFNNLTLDNSAGLTLTSPAHMKRHLLLVNGNMASNGNLTLLSMPSMTAMVTNIGTSVVTGDATVQRHVTPYGPRPVGLGYTYFSNPTNGGTVSTGFGDDMPLVFNPAYKFNCWLYPAPFSSAPFPNFYFYNESLVNTGTDPACNGESLDKFETGWASAAASTNLGIMTGYCVNIAGNTTVDITGVLNNGTLNKTLTRSSAAANAGWNLIGNPYPSPINWDLAYNMNSSLVAAQMMRRVATGTYSGTWAYYVANVPGSGTNGATNEIAGMQGFFVRALTNGNFQLNNTVRPVSYQDPQFFRTKPFYFDLMKLELSNAKGADETVIYFSNQSNDAFEWEKDAWKSQLNSAPLPNLFTSVEDKRCAVSGFAELTDEYVIPLNFIAAEAGNHRLRISSIENFNDTEILLEDKLLNKTHPLKSAPYVFHTEKGEQTERFNIRFKPSAERATQIPAVLSPNPATDKISLRLPKKMSCDFRIVNTLGQVLMTGSIDGREFSLDVKELPSGMYVVETVHELGKESLKFIKE
jgi:hypothetical protein